MRLSDGCQASGFFSFGVGEAWKDVDRRTQRKIAGQGRLLCMIAGVTVAYGHSSALL